MYNMFTRHPYRVWLIIGDILAALAVTLVGFFTHYGELSGSRWLTTFLPVLAAWFITAPWFGVYNRAHSAQTRQVWRAVLAAVISAPLAATLRGLWLNAAIAPVFVLVMMATNGLGFLIWRAVWTRLANRTAIYG